MYDKKAAVEAILFANGSPAEPDKIAQAIEMEPSQAEKLILELMDDYEKQERGIRIIKLNKSYQMVSAKNLLPKSVKLWTCAEILRFRRRRLRCLPLLHIISLLQRLLWNRSEA